jgi:hypothetical protein
VNSVQIASPIFAGRDLILGGSGTNSGCASGLGSGNGGQAAIRTIAHTVVVGGIDPAGGNLIMTNSQNQIGNLTNLTPPDNLHDIHVVPGSGGTNGKCSTQANVSLHACNWGAVDKIYATTHDNVLPPYQTDDLGNILYDSSGNPIPFIQKPTMTCCSPYGGSIAPAPQVGDPFYPYSTMGFWYRNADLAPKTPCSFTNGQTPPFHFDSTTVDTADGSINNSATPMPAPAINLTPNQSYTCRSYAGSTIRGELSWDNSLQKLTVHGTIFIDGSATINPSGIVTSQPPSNYVDPNADGASNAWTKSAGTSGSALVDDGVRSPATPSSGTDDITSGIATPAPVQDLVFPNTLVYNAGDTFKLWVYGEAGNKRDVTAAFSFDDSTFGTANTVPLSKSSFGWQSVTIPITSQGQLDGLRVQLGINVGPGGGATTAEVDAAYVEQTPAVSSTGVATYTGQGAIILSGTFGMKNASMCVFASGSVCDTGATWDPNAAVLLIYADGNGGADTTQNQGNTIGTGEGIALKSANFQGGLVANNVINIGTTSGMQGPMVSVYKSVLAGQSGILTFPPINFAPSGGGGITNPPPPPKLLDPQQFSGG